MADWKQITARIRRARTGKDPAGQLAMLFAKTRDAMVAFELARYHETAGNTDDAGKWYLTAAERFRRSDWKTKAQESATRLGATVPAEIPEIPKSSVESDKKEVAAKETAEPTETIDAVLPHEKAAETKLEGPEAQRVSGETRVGRAHGALPGQKRGRGRRGGREQQRPIRERPVASEVVQEVPVVAKEATEEAEVRVASSRLEERREIAFPTLRGRSGDPGLSSRLSQLEMSFRRLLACSPVKLEDAASAPAGPGVWVLTDEDLSTYYYVESCQTLRVGIGQVLRGSNRSGQPLKPQLADHLGIAESRVLKYLSDHCVVRWLQMDDGASHFAHFLIAVLHPTLNE